MVITPRRFVGDEESRRTPNIVVDGAPNESTVLTLTHWPGQPQPAGLAADTSAEMAFRYLDAPVEHEPAQVVTNNHFDQDGTVGLLALIEPDLALRRRDPGRRTPRDDATGLGPLRHHPMRGSAASDRWSSVG